jgi:hypothetical protein
MPERLVSRKISRPPRVPSPIVSKAEAPAVEGPITSEQCVEEDLASAVDQCDLEIDLAEFEEKSEGDALSSCLAPLLGIRLLEAGAHALLDLRLNGLGEVCLGKENMEPLITSIVSL